MERRGSSTGLLAIFSVFLVGIAVVGVTPAMAKFATAFPGENIALIATLPSLFMVPATIISGLAVGKKVSYRMMSIAGSFLFLIGGILPAFTDSFTVVLIGRAIFGCGLGFLAPLAQALVIGLYKGQKQGTYLGYGQLLMNLGGIILQMFAGFLVEIDWHYTFFVYLIGILPLAMAFFLEEPNKSNQEGADAAAKGRCKVRVSTFVWCMALLTVLMYIFEYPIMVNAALIFEVKNAGGPTAVALALSLMTVFGCLAGFIFGQTLKFCKRFTIASGFFLIAIGILLISLGNGAVVMTAGFAVVGLGASTVSPAIFGVVGMHSRPVAIQMEMSIIVACINIGNFLCTYWLLLLNNVVGESVMSSTIAAAIVFAILGVIFCIYNPYPHRTFEVPSTSETLEEEE